MLTEEECSGEKKLLMLEIPNEILGTPVVELSKDFCLCSKRKFLDGVSFIPETLIIPKNLKRIRCRLQDRGIEKVIVSPENKELFFDDYAWYENGGKTVVASWHNNHAWPGNDVHFYIIREGTIEACPELSPNFYISRLYFPASFSKIHKGFLKYWGGTVSEICADYDSCMREYAEKIDVKFIPIDRPAVILSEDKKTLLSCSQFFAENSFTIPDTVTSIKEFAFKGNEGIKEIVIPDSVVEIGEGAFAECAALESVKISNAVKTLPDRLFAECGKLKKVTFPESLVVIGKECFANTALEKVELPETVEQIGDCAFAMDSFQKHLKTIELPKTVHTIGKNVCAFIPEITVYDSIDPTAKASKDYYDDINGSWNSRVGCIGIQPIQNSLNTF